MTTTRHSTSFSAEYVRANLTLVCRVSRSSEAQEARLSKMKIALAEAFYGSDLIKSILFISHRWEEPGLPTWRAINSRRSRSTLRRTQLLSGSGTITAACRSKTTRSTRRRAVRRRAPMSGV